MAWVAPKVDWTAPDRFVFSDANRIEGNILWLKEQHVDHETGIHGATFAATASKLVQRDAAGRTKMAAPSAEDDVAIKATVTEEASARSAADSALAGSFASYLPLAGGALTGKVTAMPAANNTAQVRSIKLMTTVPTVDDLNPGEIAMVYEV